MPASETRASSAALAEEDIESWRNVMSASETRASSAMPAEEDIEFFGKLWAEILTPLDGEAEARATRKAGLERLKSRLESHKGVPTKADLYEFDRLRLETASADEIVAQAPGLYRKYCQERGLTIDPNDLAMKPPPPDKMNALRARMLEILRALHWSYTFGPIREKRRVRLLKESMLVMIAATVIMGVLVAIFNDQRFFAMLVTVVYAGVMGGAVSCARRLGDVSTTDDALGSIYALKNSHYVLVFAPLTGAVFAVVTMLVFMGGLMTGPLFPSFTGPATAALVSGGWHFTRALLPSAGSGYALLFVWCFIAGFAERFIPDTLDGLTKRAAKQKTEPGKEGVTGSNAQE